MPRLRRDSKRRADEVETAAIRAGLRGLPCPEGCNPFVHLVANHPSRSVAGWGRVVAAWRAMLSEERRDIIHARRDQRDAMGAVELRRAHRGRSDNG